MPLDPDIPGFGQAIAIELEVAAAEVVEIERDGWLKACQVKHGEVV